MGNGWMTIEIPMGLSEEASEIIADVLSMQDNPKELVARIVALPDQREQERIFEMIDGIAEQKK